MTAASLVEFDQLALERTVRTLSKVGIRKTPLTLDGVKAWVKQFQTDAERTLAWLMLRSLVFRTSEQLESVMRQALKQAVNHYLSERGSGGNANWREAAAATDGDLSFYCGPPTLDGQPQPGKSGEIVTRLVNRSFGVPKWYPNSITQLLEGERYLVVDDGLFTGLQLEGFLQQWGQRYDTGRIGIVVGIAHEVGIEYLARQFPDVRVFCGERLTADNCFLQQCAEWVTNGQWPHAKTPGQTYLDICHRHGFTNGQLGFGSLGVMVAYEHGIPDDALRLLWGRAPDWKPLVER